MRSLALVRVAVREHLRVRSLIALLLAFAVWIAIADGVVDVQGESRLHVRERAVASAAGGIGGLFAILVGTMAFAGEIRRRRLMVLASRPVSAAGLVLGKACGLFVAVGVVAVMLFAAGLGWILLTGAGDARPASFSIAHATRVELGGTPLADGDLVRVGSSGPALIFHFEGIDRLGDDGRARMRLDLRHAAESMSLRVPVTIVLGEPEAVDRREISTILHRRRSFEAEVFDRDVDADGGLTIGMRADGGAALVRVDRSSIAVRAARVPYVVAYLQVAVLAWLGMVLLAGVGVALSTLLPAASGALLLITLHGTGHLRPFVIDLADGLAGKGIAVAGAAAREPSLPAMLNELALRSLAALSPPVAEFRGVDALVAQQYASTAPIVDAAVTCGLYLLPALVLGSLALGRRARS